VHLRAAHVVVRDLLARGGLDEPRAAERHRGRALDHGHEVGKARDVGSARGARPQHRGDLGDDPGHHDLVVEEIARAREGGARRLLDAGAGRVEQPHDWLAVAQRQLANAGGFELLADRAHRSGHDREVVGDHPDLAAVDVAVAGDHAVGGRAIRVKLAAAVRLLVREQAELDERVLVEQEAKPLADRELASLLLLGDLLGTAHAEVLLAARFELGDLGREFVAHDGQFY